MISEVFLPLSLTVVHKSEALKGYWTNCRHIYFIFSVIRKLDAQTDLFMHTQSFGFNKVKCILEGKILIYAIK